MAPKYKKYEKYEQLSSDLAKLIFTDIGGIEDVKHGAKNLWLGASGYEHQIDVSIHGNRDIWLIECKCWRRTVSTEAVLTFAARICDIRAKRANDIQLHPSLFTVKGFQSGAKKLAAFFGIELSHVTSKEEFLIRIKHAIAAAVADNIRMKDGVKMALGIV